MLIIAGSVFRIIFRLFTMTMVVVVVVVVAHFFPRIDRIIFVNDWVSIRAFSCLISVGC